jgi:hypothetical protein
MISPTLLGMTSTAVRAGEERDHVSAASRYVGTAANRKPNWRLASKTDDRARANL